MTEIVETTQLEFDKSSFLIDLVEYSPGLLYIEITQAIYESPEKKQTLKINPSILTDLLKVLQNYQAKRPDVSDERSVHLKEEDQQKMVDRYLRGVSIEELILQFDQTEELIHMVLRNKGISIVTQKAKRRRRR